MNELLYKEKVFQLVGICMEVHRELGKGHDEVVYKDALVVELSRAGIRFLREKNYAISRARSLIGEKRAAHLRMGNGLFLIDRQSGDTCQPAQTASLGSS
jgi:GxxExxY protein